MTDPLITLFGSSARVKLLRLFLFNPKQSFSQQEIVARARIRPREASHEVALLLKIKLIRVYTLRSKTKRYAIDSSFAYLETLQALLLNAAERGGDIYERIKRSGSIKLLVLSGVFVGDWEGRLDLLIVGDRLNEKTLKKSLVRFESEIGKELSYTLLSTEDFFYRLNMNDHLVRDVLDYSHRIAFDRLNIGLK